jgi:lipopolysaccharide transport system ATP-binding protein
MKPILEIKNISKQFLIGRQQEKYLSLRDSIAGFFKRKINQDNEILYALQDLSFDVHQGESIGIIGRNGAGKSTLLKILSKITPPTSGNIICRGRIASLLEVGTGFHSELTGRDNIYMNGSILGMRKWEIDKHFDAIVEFSGVERFLDTPLKHYSSGMQLRLAFSVAAHLEPEIMIIDEVLSVGDAEFQKKCLGKMDEVSKSGRTVLFVSHQLGTIAQLCSKSILLDKGKLIIKDKTSLVIDRYLKNQTGVENVYNADLEKVKYKEAFFVSQKIVDEKGFVTNEITTNERINLEIKICVQDWHKETQLSLSLQHTIKGRIFTVDFNLRDIMVPTEKEKIIRFSVPANFIVPNNYSWISALHIPGSPLFDVLWDECQFSIKDGGTEFARYEGVDYGVILLKDYSLDIL